jgi:uncharacterized protein YpmS
MILEGINFKKWKIIILLTLLLLLFILVVGWAVVYDSQKAAESFFASFPHF